MFEKIFVSMDEIKKETVEICAMQNGCEDCPFYRYTCTGFTLLNDLQDQCNVLKSLERDWNCKHRFAASAKQEEKKESVR